MVVNVLLVGLVAGALWNVFWIHATANRALLYLPRSMLAPFERAIRNRLYFAAAMIALLIYRALGG